MDSRFLSGALRILIAIGLVLALALQVFVLPWLSGHMAQDDPEVAYLRWPVLTASILGLVCVEIILACTWKLLGAIGQSQIFRLQSLRWVDAIIWCLVVIVLLTLAVVVEVFAASIGPITVPAFGVLAVLVGAGILLLMIVMRGLLRQASSLQADMDAVI